MKKLLSVIAVLLLAITLVPVQSFAGARGSITPITQGSDLTDGGHSTIALRPFPAQASGDKGEYWMALTSRNTDEGFQTIRTIYQFTNATSDPTALAFMGGALQAPFFFAGPDPWSADHVRAPLLTDPLRIDSYTDPAWSPDGRFLAYVKTDKFVSSSAIFVQEFDLNTAAPENEITHATKIGSPIAVTDGFLGDGHQNRHPPGPDGNSLTFDSIAPGSATTSTPRWCSPASERRSARPLTTPTARKTPTGAARQPDRVLLEPVRRVHAPAQGSRGRRGHVG
jgi:hypothetical protein